MEEGRDDSAVGDLGVLALVLEFVREKLAEERAAPERVAPDDDGLLAAPEGPRAKLEQAPALPPPSWVFETLSERRARFFAYFRPSSPAFPPPLPSERERESARAASRCWPKPRRGLLPVLNSTSKSEGSWSSSGMRGKTCASAGCAGEKKKEKKGEKKYCFPYAGSLCGRGGRRRDGDGVDVGRDLLQRGEDVHAVLRRAARLLGRVQQAYARRRRENGWGVLLCRHDEENTLAKRPLILVAARHTRVSGAPGRASRIYISFGKGAFEKPTSFAARLRS